MSKILGENGGTRGTEDYVTLDAGDVELADVGSDTLVHIADIGDKSDVVDIKDAVYDGDIVIADVTRLRINDSTMEHIIDDLQQVAREVDGDIVQKGDDQIIIVPQGCGISRRKLA